MKFKNKMNRKSIKEFYKNFSIDYIKQSYLNKFKLKNIKKFKIFVNTTLLKKNQKSSKNDKKINISKSKKRAYFKELFNSSIQGGSLLFVPKKINQLKNNIDFKLIQTNGINQKFKILYNKKISLYSNYIKDLKLNIKNKISRNSKIKLTTQSKNKFTLPPQIIEFFNKYLSKPNNFKEKLLDDSFVIIHFSDHILTIAKVSINESINSVDQLLSINVPTDIIGDYKVENKNELSNILKDVISLYEINKNPIVLLLSSTFFTIKSFDDGELVVFSENNPELLSKSPYLPDDTLMQHTRVSGNKLSSYHRVVYINKSVLDSWIEVLSMLENPLAGVTCSCIHLVEEITNTYGGLTVLCDIELNSTVIYLEKSNCEFNAVKLPFGSSIYISDDENTRKQFFVRLENSINSIIEKYKYKSPKSIYLIGQGFDKLNSTDLSSFKNFREFPLDIFNKYKLSKDIDKETRQNNISNIIKVTSITQVLNK